MRQPPTVEKIAAAYNKQYRDGLDRLVFENLLASVPPTMVAAAGKAYAPYLNDTVVLLALANELNPTLEASDGDLAGRARLLIRTFRNKAVYAFLTENSTEDVATSRRDVAILRDVALATQEPKLSVRTARVVDKYLKPEYPLGTIGEIAERELERQRGADASRVLMLADDACLAVGLYLDFFDDPKVVRSSRALPHLLAFSYFVRQAELEGKITLE